MSIRLLHPDARSLMEKLFKKWDDMTTEMERTSRTVAVWTPKRPPSLSKESLDKLTTQLRQIRDEIRRILDFSAFWTRSRSEPCELQMPYETTKDFFGRKVAAIILVYQGPVYAVSGPYTSEEAKLILLDSLRKKKRKAEYLVARKDIPVDEVGYKRQPISEEVRQEVWRRDRGRCARCGSVINLEFDHIVPVSQGGANTARNIQVLCETCNRQKGNNIG